MKFLALALVVLITPCAHSTTHFLISDGHKLSFGSDGKMVLENFGERQTCKVVEADNLLFFEWGHISEYLSINGSSPQLSFSYETDVKRILASGKPIDAKYADLVEAARRVMVRIKARRRQLNLPLDKVTFTIGGLLVWIDKGSPKMKRLDVSETSITDETLKNWHSDATENFDVYHLYQFPEDKNFSFKGTAREARRTAQAKDQPEKVIEYDLGIMSQKHPDEDGPPFSIGEFTGEKLTWTQPGACKQD